jgi:hypothetical protein
MIMEEWSSLIFLQFSYVLLRLGLLYQKLIFISNNKMVEGRHNLCILNP